jgi:hypothetical protein
MPAVDHLIATNLEVGAPPKRRHRRRSLASTLRAARKAGAGHAEILEGRIVISLAANLAPPTDDSAGSLDRNEWDAVLPGGDRGAR